MLMNIRKLHKLAITLGCLAGFTFAAAPSASAGLLQSAGGAISSGFKSGRDEVRKQTSAAGQSVRKQTNAAKKTVERGRKSAGQALGTVARATSKARLDPSRLSHSAPAWMKDRLPQGKKLPKLDAPSISTIRRHAPTTASPTQFPSIKRPLPGLPSLKTRELPTFGIPGVRVTTEQKRDLRKKAGQGAHTAGQVGLKILGGFAGSGIRGNGGGQHVADQSKPESPKGTTKDGSKKEKSKEDGSKDSEEDYPDDDLRVIPPEMVSGAY